MRTPLPWPPSINHYWRRVGPRTLISREGREYRSIVCGLLARLGETTRDGRVAVCIDAHPPDRRRRDVDNIQKAPLDAMEHAGIYENDGQIDLLVTRRKPPFRGGKIVVTVEDLPLDRCPLCGTPHTTHGDTHENQTSQ